MEGVINAQNNYYEYIEIWNIVWTPYPHAHELYTLKHNYTHRQYTLQSTHTHILHSLHTRLRKIIQKKIDTKNTK